MRQWHRLHQRRLPGAGLIKVHTRRLLDVAASRPGERPFVAAASGLCEVAGKLFVVADDEPLARDELSFLLQEFPALDIVSTASNGPEAVQKIQDLEPELVFLDVQMPGLDGMGVIRKIRVPILCKKKAADLLQQFHRQKYNPKKPTQY